MLLTGSRSGSEIELELELGRGVPTASCVMKLDHVSAVGFDTERVRTTDWKVDNSWCSFIWSRH